METGQEMADFIVSQMSVELPTVTVDATRQYGNMMAEYQWTSGKRQVGLL
jgi:hypothetical protein